MNGVLAIGLIVIAFFLGAGVMSNYDDNNLKNSTKEGIIKIDGKYYSLQRTSVWEMKKHE